MRKAFRIAAASLILAGAITTVPVAAQANFTASTTAVLPVSTAVLTVHDGAVTGSCALRNGQNIIAVAVELTMTSPRATSHPFRIFSPDGVLRYTGDAAISPRVSFRVPGNLSVMTGTWIYEIHDEYLPEGSSMAWIGKTASGPFVC